jgi:hypothetical protein
VPLKASNRTGLRFGRRVVLQMIRRKGKRLRWKFRCDCGRTAICLTQDLTRGKGCKFCVHKGPRPYRRKRPFEATYNAFVSRSKHAVNISYEQFVSFTQIPNCHYCDIPVIWGADRRETTATNLDRKDNYRPYDFDNLVVCCLRCNKSKNTHFTYEEWKSIGAVIRNWRT